MFLDSVNTYKIPAVMPSTLATVTNEELDSTILNLLGHEEKSKENANQWKSLFERVVVSLDKVQMPQQTTDIYKQCVRIVYLNLVILQKKFDAIESKAIIELNYLNSQHHEYYSSKSDCIEYNQVAPNVLEIRRTTTSPYMSYGEANFIKGAMQRFEELKQQSIQQKGNESIACICQVLDSAIRNKNFFLANCILKMAEVGCFGDDQTTYKIIQQLKLPHEKTAYYLFETCFNVEEGKVLVKAFENIYAQWRTLFQKYCPLNEIVDIKDVKDLLKNLVEDSIQRHESNAIQFYLSLNVLKELDITGIIHDQFYFICLNPEQELKLETAQFIIDLNLVDSFTINQYLAAIFTKAIKEKDIVFASKILSLKGHNLIPLCVTLDQIFEDAVVCNELNVAKYIESLMGEIDQKVVKNALNRLNQRIYPSQQALAYLKTLDKSQSQCSVM